MRSIIRSRFLVYTPAILMGLFLLIILSPLSKTAKAESKSINWSWSAGEPTVSSPTKVADLYRWCSGSFQLEEVVGETDLKRVCITSKGAVRFGMYFSGSYFQSVVGFKYDDKMYRVMGICRYSDDCLYVPSSDTFITKQYLINGIVRSLVVYKNFTHRLSPFVNGLMLTHQYVFDSSNPDYTFQNAEGYQWPIGGFGASDNGRWLAVEFRQRGIGLLDIETLKMRRISTMSFKYDVGTNPWSELAVSDSGQAIAIMGLNSGLSILDVFPGCGDEATDIKMMDVLPISNPCKFALTNTNKYVDRFFYATNPRFNDDGGELDFYTLSYVDESSSVTLRASGYVEKSLDYLALGDSFTSGEGETDDKYYLKGTNDKYEKCHVSTRSYPFLISNFMKIESLNMANVACSGATTKDIVGTNSNYWGQGGRLKDTTNLDESYKTDAQSYAMYELIPGRIYQESFVNKYSPKVITVGIGGNDAGLMEKLSACAGKDTCDWANNSESKEQTADEIKRLFGTLVNTYQKINITSPSSKIYAIGYPKIINQSGKCDVLTGFLFDEVERKFMNESVAYLNQIVEAAAKSAGIKYVDIQGSYTNHVLCGSESPSAMNGGRLGDDNQYNWLLNVGNESFHPNSLGHKFGATAINDSVGNLLTYEYCNDGNTICPDSTTIAPEPSTYWVPAEKHNYPAQQTASYLSNRDESNNNRQKQIVLDDNSLKPNSSVEVEITSETISLGSFSASETGSLMIDFDLPINLEEGYHTMHLYGTSYSGELVELYQVFEYKKPVAESDKDLVISTVTNINNNESSEASTNVQNDDDSPYQEAVSIDESENSNVYSYNPEVKGVSDVANKTSKTDMNRIVDSVFGSKLFYGIAGVTAIFVLLIIVLTILRIRRAN